MLAASTPQHAIKALLWPKARMHCYGIRTVLMSVIAFHEKAGRSQVIWRCGSLVNDFSSAESPLSPSFHPHSLMSDSVSLGASWAFSITAGAAICLSTCTSIASLEVGPGD
jgi:hypothetical protein